MIATTGTDLITPWKLLLIVSCWLIASIAGVFWLLDYSQAAGPAGDVARVWHENPLIKPTAGSRTLLVFLHPRCPCSRATLSEMERILPQVRTSVAPLLVFVIPEDAGREWLETDLWNHSLRLPRSSRIVDRGGQLARGFGVSTSGHCLLFSGQSRLLFAGGITASRGHEGNNYGRTSLTQLLNGDVAEVTETPVFGCPLPINATAIGSSS